MAKFLLFVSSLFLFLGFAPPAVAANEFFTQYQVLYEATREGTMKIAQEVSLTNKLSNIYATEYTFSLERGQPQNIQAFDENGPLEVVTETQGEITKIKVRFKSQVVGKGKSFQFTLNYEVPEFLRQFGQVWEITLPKIQTFEEIDEYQLTLKVPGILGKLAYISPSPQDQKSEGENQLFFFEKEQLAQSGVVAAFGQFQVFDFVLTYHLSNPHPQKIKRKMALPPDTSYQKITYQEIKPEPLNIELDGDGNWLGIYELKPGEKLEIVATGQVKIFAHPQPELSPFLLLNADFAKYLQPQKYWETENEEIKRLAEKLKTPKEISDFVVKKLDYDYSRVRQGAERLGATGALFNPERAICMEYTDLFIAISRAAGIPARELNGFAYTTNPFLQPLSLAQDILHAWPEYWDSQRKTWVQIDPTWQDTTGGVDYFSKLDLGHFVFAIHGQMSEWPPPAGAYKDERGTRKDVEISFGQYKESSPPLLKVDFVLPQELVSEKPTEGKIRLINPGGEAIANLQISLKTENLRLLSEPQKLFPLLLPFSYQEIPLKLAAPGLFSQGSDKILLLANQQKFDYNLKYQSFTLKWLLPFLGAGLLVVILFYLAHRLKGLHSLRNAELKKNT